MNTTTTPELGISEEEIAELRLLASGAIRDLDSDDLPEGTRQILVVSGHTLISSNFVESQATGRTGGDAQMILRGKPSPSSDPLLNTAYITFVADGVTLRRPSYSKAQGKLWLWMHFRSLPLVLTQIHEPSVYCWIGRFAGGHIWADVHAGH